MSRVLLNDPQVAKKITDHFIPFSGAVERLQPSRYGNPESPVSRWFQPVAKAGLKRYAPPKWWEEFQTYQGLYVLGADGACYDYQVVWKLPAAKYAGILDQALARFAAKPPKPVEIAAKLVKAATPTAPAASTSILRVYSRIRPVPQGCDESNRGIGRDHMWIFDDEVRELLQTAQQAGERPFPMPERITGRLVRFHLLDTVRNVSPSFSEKDVTMSKFVVRMVRAKQDVIQFVFQGDYASAGKSEESGEIFRMAGWLQGEFEVDKKRLRIERFRAYGQATASGQNNAMAPQGDYPVVFGIVDAYDDVSQAVPPFYHDVSPIWRPIYRNPRLPAQGR